MPDAPEGAHSSQVGTLLGGAVAIADDEPLDPDRPDEGATEVAGSAGTRPRPEPALTETPAAGPVDPAAALDVVVVPGNVTAPGGPVRAVPALPEVCAGT